MKQKYLKIFLPDGYYETSGLEKKEIKKWLAPFRGAKLTHKKKALKYVLRDRWLI